MFVRSGSRFSSIIHKDRLTSKKHLQVALSLASSFQLDHSQLPAIIKQFATCLSTNTNEICSSVHAEIWERGSYQHRVWRSASV